MKKRFFILMFLIVFTEISMLSPSDELGFGIDPVFAHGDENHGAKEQEPTPKTKETHDSPSSAISKTSTGITLTKELQLRLNITTEKVAQRSVKETIRLMGHVISDPSGYARVQSSQNGRILNDPQYPLPLPGQKVLKDQIILSLEPTLGKTETSAQKTLLYKIESEIDQLRKDVERKEKLIQFIPKKDLEIAKSELDRALKQREEISNKTLTPEYLKSPLDGIVSDLHVRPGEIVTPDKTIVEIVDPSRLMVEALLFDSTLSDKIEKGYARLPLRSDKNIPLDLLGVTPKVNKEDQAIHILFKIPESDPSIKLDMAIEVLAELKSTNPTLTISKNAVAEDSSGTWVFVKTGPETFERRKVHINRYVDQYAEISEGITVGDTVVVQGSYLLNQAR